VEGLEQRPGGGTVDGLADAIARFAPGVRAEAGEQQRIAEHTADVGHGRHLAGLEQTAADRAHNGGQVFGRALHEFERDGVPGGRGLRHESGHGGDAGPGKVGGVETVQQVLQVARGGGLQ